MQYFFIRENDNMIDLIVILLIAVLSWREVQILIDRGSWKKENLRFNPYWYIDQNSKEKVLWVIPKKNLDSFHVANGVATILILEMIIHYLPLYTFSIQDGLAYGLIIQAYVGLYWLVWMQIRNLFMEVIYRG